MDETIYLIPGLLCDAAVWQHQVAALSRTYDVRIPDLGGFSSIEAMADAVLADAPPRFSLAGHSMGGRVALQIIHQAPNRVIRLALLDTGVHPPRPSEAASRQVLLDISAKQGMVALAERWLPPMVRDGALDARPELHAALLEMMLRMSPAIHRNQIAALLSRPDARPVLSSITCPVLVGVGEADQWSPPSQHEEIVAAIPGARYVTFANSGHMAPIEAPEAVTAALEEWMSLTTDSSATWQYLITRHSDRNCDMTAGWEIEQTIRRFAILSDAGDSDGVAELFTVDGTFARPNNPKSPIIGKEAIRSFFRDRPPRETRHVVANTVVQLTSDAAASAQSYVVLYMPDKVLVGHYHDSLIHLDGEWLFVERRGSLAFP